MNVRSLGLVVCMLLITVGCGKKEAEDAAGGGAGSVGTATSPQTGDPGSAAADDGAATTVKLLDPGTEPRTPLRYQFQAGGTQRMVMEMKMAMAMEAGGMQQPEMQMPVTRMTMAVDSKEVTAAGDLRYEFRLEEVKVLPTPGANAMMVAAMEQQMTGMVGMSGSGTVTSRGVTRDVDVKLAAGANPQAAQLINNMKQSMNQMSAPLPREPVGKGARWQVTMPLEMQMMKLAQIATYTLTDIQGEKVTFDVAIKQSAPPQEIAAQGAPPGTKVSLESLSSSGSGTIELDLTNSLVPTSSMNVTSTSVFVTNDQKMKMKMRMEMDIHP